MKRVVFSMGLFGVICIIHMIRHLECRYGQGCTIVSMIETARGSIQENRIVKSRPKNEITSLLAKLDDERKVESLRLQEQTLTLKGLRGVILTPPQVFSG